MSFEPMFSPESMRDRREFNQLFGGTFLMRVEHPKALHSDPWNSNIIGNILRNVNPQNGLSDSDLETMLQMCGYYDKEHQIWMGKGACSKLPEFVVDAIAPYVDTQQYLDLKMCSLRQQLGSAERFFQLVCNTKLPKIRVPQTDVFRIYQEWCEVIQLPLESKRTLYTTLEAHGLHTKKGYVNKKCGVVYYELGLQMGEVAWNVQSERAALQKRQEEAQPAKPLRDESRGGEEVPSVPVEDGEAEVSAETVRQDAPDSGCGDCTEDGATDVINAECADDFSYDDGVSDDDSSEDGEIADDDGAGRDFSGPFGAVVSPAPEADCGEERLTADIVRNKIKGLAPDVRRFFKLMRVTYLVNPDHFTYDDFKEYYETSGFPRMQEDKLISLYRLFVQYAKLR